MITLSESTRATLQAAVRDMKRFGEDGWCQGYLTDFHDRWCAMGRVILADKRMRCGTSPAMGELGRGMRLAGLPMLSRVNDARGQWHGMTGFEGAVALLEHVLVESLPDWEPSQVQGSQHEFVLVPETLAEIDYEALD